jgi:hypothetical protein
MTLASEVALEYVKKQEKDHFGEADAAHREPSVAEFYNRIAWQWHNIGLEIVEHLKKQGL